MIHTTFFLFLGFNFRSEVELLRPRDKCDPVLVTLLTDDLRDMLRAFET